MKSTCMLISAPGVDAARKVYEDLFGLDVFQGYGRNIIFICGPALWQDFDCSVEMDASVEDLTKLFNN